MKNQVYKTIAVSVASLAIWNFVAKPFLEKITNKKV